MLRSQLEIDRETMRVLGYRVVDLLVDRIADLDNEPAWQGATRSALRAKLNEPPPADGAEFDAIVSQLVSDALPYGARVDHARFMGFVPGSPTWPGILADFIAAGYNIFQGSWLAGSGASMIELIVIDWFKQWIGYPASASGLFLSGGSVANLTALACARLVRFGAHSDMAVIYTSSETHSSTERAARVLGFSADRVRKLHCTGDQHLDVTALAAAVDADRAAGLVPFAVIANGGTTSTGAIDPLPELVAICRANDIWLHIDAAYGGFAVLTDRGRTALAGIEGADSITLDPHKWLYQPFEAGCLLVRDGNLLENAFRVMPHYLQDAAVISGSADERPVNFMDRGVQLTRSARALKVWVSLKYFGTKPFRDTIDRTLDLAIHAEQRIRSSREFELLTPARLGIVCFRRVLDMSGNPIEDEAELEEWNAHLVHSLAASGEGLISSTRVNGRYALRFCILSHRSREADVDRILDWLRRTS